MNYYARPVSKAPVEVWQIEEDFAVRVGVVNPERSRGAYFKAGPGETIWDTICRATPWFENGENPFQKIVLGPGEFYPRIARPTGYLGEMPGWGPGANSEERDVMAIAQGQLGALTRQLDRICQTVQPMEKTLEVFGHDIRNLLILACTEVENHWRGILEANGVDKDRFDTRDYVALQGAMRLDEYAVKFADYPWLDAFKPYQGWGSPSQPTQKLRWYDAYNAVKHSRETQFERGTLRQTFEAISACIVIMAAQFGWPTAVGRRQELFSYFQFSAHPIWSPSEIYILPNWFPGRDWSPVNFPFKAFPGLDVP